VEALPHDDPRLVEDEDPGIWKIGMPRIWLDPVRGMVFLYALVDEAEAPDDVAPLVREQRKRDTVLVGEGPKHRHGIVAQGEEGDARGFERGQYLLQLDQLRLAEGSPVGAAVEDDERLAVAPGGVQVHRRTALVRQADFGEPLALARTYS
jgi:hypothetical protein